MRKFLKEYRWFVLATAILLMAYTGVSAWAGFPYGSTQVVAHGDLVALQGAGLIAWKTNPGWASTDGQGATINEVNTYVNGCSLSDATYGTGRLATNNEVHACAVVSTTVSQLNDPWLTSTTTYWTQSGGVFVANTSISGSPTGANWFESASGSTNTATIKQTITPTTITSGTTLVARAYLARTSQTDNNSNSCGDYTGAGTMTGTATLEIENSAGTPVASVSATSAAMTQMSVSYSVATAGQYYVVGSVTTDYESYTYDGTFNNTTRTCTIHAGTAQGIGEITDLTIGNS